VQLKVTSHT